MNIFELTIPRTEHPKKSQTSLPPFSLAVHPSTHRDNIAIEKKAKPTHEKKRKLTADKNHANPCHSILRRTRNERSIPRPEFQDEENSKIRKQKIDKKNDLPASSTCLYVVHTYYTYLVPPTYYTYMRSFCPLSHLSKKENLRVLLLFFSLLTKSQRGEEKKGKGKKKEGGEEKKCKSKKRK